MFQKVKALIMSCLLLSNIMYAFNVHIYGDSHAFFCFSNQVRGAFDERSVFCSKIYDEDLCLDFFIHHMGPITMYRIGRDGLAILNISSDVKNGDTVVFVFGEIDVRCHIGKQRDLLRRDIHEIIDSLVINYLKTVIDNTLPYKKLNIVVLGVVPPSDKGHTNAFPVYGTLSDRVDISSILNKKLQSECKKKSFYFLDITDYFQISDGSLDPELSDGVVHVGLAHNRVIKEKLLELIHKE